MKNHASSIQESGQALWPSKFRVVILSRIFWLAVVLSLFTQPVSSPHAQSVPAISAQQAQQVLDVLNDPQKRAAFAQTLNTIVKAQQSSASQSTTSPAASTPSTTTTSSNSTVVTPKTVALGLDLKSEIASAHKSIVVQTRSFVSLFRDFAFVAHWFKNEVSNPTLRATLLDAFLRATGIFLVVLGIERGLSLLLRKPLRSITAAAVSLDHKRAAKAKPANIVRGDIENAGSSKDRATDERRQRETLRILVRIPFSLLHLLIKLVPVAVCACVGFFGASLLTETDQAQLFTLALIQSYVGARVLYMVVEMIFMPSSPEIRLCTASTATSKIVVRWFAILVAAPAVASCLTQLGAIFTLSSRGTDAMIRAVVLVMHILFAIFIWRIRNIVANALQPTPDRSKQTSWATIGHIASFWWLPAIFVDIALWVVWATKLSNGYHWILTTALMTIVLLAASRVIAILVYGLQEKLFRIRPEIEAQYPGLQQRANFYYPLARRATRVLLVAASIVLLLQVWGLPSIAFLTKNPVGTRFVALCITFCVAVTVGIVLWEGVNNLLERRIAVYNGNGVSERASRLRTVLPIIRTVLATIIIIVIFITTLAQFGINVTPILTGAGLLGAAIAFGSQSLVKDFITGFFMLVENAMQVGDTVTAGSVTGTVEHLSIRTLRLRASSGEIFIIPFSSVSSVSNNSRDYNYVSISLQLALDEDPDRVVALMRGVVSDMREDDVYGGLILDDYKHLSINRADGSGTNIVGKIMTKAGSRDTVDREFFARLRPKFVSEGIKFPGSSAISQLVTNQPIDIRISQTPPTTDTVIDQHSATTAQQTDQANVRNEPDAQQS